MRASAAFPCVLALLAAVSIAPSWAHSPPSKATSDPLSVLELDRDGTPTSGSLEALIEGVRSGRTIRVGWRLPVRFPDDEETRWLEHWADASFLTVWDGQVFAQLRDICEQGMLVGQEEPGFHLEPGAHGWVALIGTTGVVKQAFHGEPSQMRVATSWAVLP